VPDLAVYLGVGALVGFLSGLLGIGGGVIIVSSLALLFTRHAFPVAYAMHMAIGTSLAAMMAGAASSFRAHGRRGAVDWPVVRAMAPGLLVGVWVGSASARLIEGGFLKLFFLAFMTLIIVQLVFDVRPRGSRPMPGRGPLAAFAAVIGLCSGWFGGGAAAIGVPYLTWHEMSVHRAIGTCAALGFVVALSGTVGYAVSGWGVDGMPPWSVGFVYLPAAVGISVTSILAAPLGVRLAHRLRGPALRRIFAAFLIAVAIKVALSV
jgi:uncharacterized membrane protein YfcA